MDQHRPYGPILYNGHVLVGELPGVIELWRIDSETSLPHLTSRHTVLLPSLKPDIDDCFTVSLADIFGFAERVSGRLNPAEEVRLEFDLYRRLLSLSMRAHGQQRLTDAAVKMRKWVGARA